MGTLLVIQTHRLESAKADHAAFVAKTEAAGKEQERRAKETEAADRKRKEKADAENKTSRARIATLSIELRDARSRSSYLPPATPGASSPDTATVVRADVERALQLLDDGVTRLVAEGDQAIADLNTAKSWATAP